MTKRKESILKVSQRRKIDYLQSNGKFQIPQVTINSNNRSQETKVLSGNIMLKFLPPLNFSLIMRVK